MSDGEKIESTELEESGLEAFEQRLEECDAMFERWATGSEENRANAISTIMVFATQLAVEHGLGKDEFVSTLGDMYVEGERELVRLEALSPEALEAESASVVEVNVWSKLSVERGQG